MQGHTEPMLPSAARSKSTAVARRIANMSPTKHISDILCNRPHLLLFDLILNVPVSNLSVTLG